MAVGKDEERAMMQPPDDEYELKIEREPLEEPASGTSMGGRHKIPLLAGLRGQPRRRGVEAVAVVGVLALAVVIVLNSIRGAAPEVSIAPTTGPAPEQVVLASNVTFGAFTLNGKLLKGPPPRLVTLRQDTNTITLSAPPFQPKTCTLVWPSQQPIGNACQTETGPQFVIGGQTVSPSLTVFVLVGASDLPPDLASSARAAVSAVLDSVRLHTTVPRGDYFATEDDAKGVPVARRASSALSADLTFLLPSPESTLDGAGPCGTGGFCPTPFDGSPFDGQSERVPDNVWSVSVMAAMQWTFTPPGQAPLVASPVALGSSPPLWLAYDGAGGWQVIMPSFGGGTSPTLGDQLRQGICWSGATLLGNVGGPGQHQFGMGAGGDGDKDHGVDGCVIQLYPNDGSSPAKPSGNVIWRFGALLAADAGAQKLLPMLPAAPDDEIQAVTV